MMRADIRHLARAIATRLYDWIPLWAARTKVPGAHLMVSPVLPRLRVPILALFARVGISNSYLFEFEFGN